MKRDRAKKVSTWRNWTKWELRKVHEVADGWQDQKVDPTVWNLKIAHCFSN